VRQHSKLLVLACGMLKGKLMEVSITSVRFELLEQGLHRKPNKKYKIL